MQVKRWKHNVLQPTVTQLRGSLQVYQQGIIITTSDFSKGARTEATASTKTPIGLINGNELLDLLIKHRVGVVEKPLTVIAIDEDWWGELISPAKPALPEPKAEANSLEKKPPLDPGEKQPKSKKAPGEKPPEFMLFGESHTAGTWRGLLMTVCEVVAQRHPDDFSAKAVTVKGRTRQQIAESPDGMINPLPIGNTGLWLEANQSRRSALRVVELVLTAFGYPPNELRLLQMHSTTTAK